MESQEKQYKYYAFISYSHKGNSPLAEKVRKTFPQSTLFAKEDMKWAIWLQRELESYHLPAALCEKLNIDHKQRIKPVFRDEDELGCGLIDRELNSNLDVSKYLIVLCSPNSANPNKDGFHYINDEINHFISVNGAARVIPVIIDGVPNDPERECFPPALKKHQFIAIDATKIGKEHAFSNIVAKMLNLSPDELWERDKRRLVRRRILHATVYTLLLALLAFSGYWTWDWNRDYVERYADYVDKYGLPQGIFPLAKEDVQNRHAHYRFIYSGRKTLFGERVLREVMHSNSKGYYLEADDITKKFFDRPIRQQFEYKDDFVLDRINVVDRNGKVLEQRNYSGKNMTCIDFTIIDDEGVAIGKMQKSAGIGFSSENIFQSKAEITRWRLKRDENGFLTEIRFCKNTFDVPAKNADGIYGRRFKLDQYGRPIEECYLDHNGNQMQLKNGISSVRYDYQKDAPGLLGVVWLDVSGKTGKEYKFVLDENQNFSEISFYLNGKTAYEDGTFKVKQVYLNGHRIEAAYFGIDGKPCLHKDGYAKFTSQYDERGNCIEDALFGIDGKPCLHKDGYAKVTSQYDEQGNLEEAAVFGIDGKPCLHKNGVAKFTRKYDECGNCIEQAYFGIDGKPCLSKDGYAKVTWKYDERGNCIEQAYFGTDGKPCLNKDGYAKVTSQYDKRGNRIEEAYFGIDGKPCLSNAGFAKLTLKYDERGDSIEWATFGTDDKPCLSKNGYAKFTQKYDERGNCIEFAYFGIDGKPCLLKDGYAKVTSQYDKRGNRIEDAYFGIDGKPCLHKDGNAKVTLKYDTRGNLIEQAYFGIDGKPCLHKDGYAKVTSQYDEQGNLEEAAVFGIDGKPCLHKEGFAKITNKYDERGILVEKNFWDVNNNILLPRKNVAFAFEIGVGSQAAKLGISKGDFILNYAGWDWTRGRFNAEILLTTREKEKRLIFARKNPDGSIHVFSKTFPAGMMGIHIVDTWIDGKDYNKIMEAYKKFQEQQKK